MTQRQQRVIAISAYAMIIGLGLLLLLSILELRRRLDIPAVPIEISRSVIRPEISDLCPGDILRWPLSITYNEAPLLMDVYRHLRNLDTGVLILDKTTHLTIPQENTGTFDRRSAWPIPNIAPGRYRLITTTTSAIGSELLQYYIEFRVKGDCNADH